MIARQLAASIGNINESRAAAPITIKQPAGQNGQPAVFLEGSGVKSRAHGVAAAVHVDLAAKHM